MKIWRGDDIPKVQNADRNPEPKSCKETRDLKRIMGSNNDKKWRKSLKKIYQKIM